MGRHWKYGEFLERQQREGEGEEKRGEWIISYNFAPFPPSSLYKQINRAIDKGLRLKRLQQSLFLAEGKASKEFLITLLDDEGASKVEVIGRGKRKRKKESPRIPEREFKDDLILKVLSDPILTKALGRSKSAKGMGRLIEMIEGTFEEV
ncbi:MAG: hypothetical protein MASP_01266 [Candidatus Methanolliviera sp. GoM_asphalt]|nr:MAG: hypothetical protein MASP_01266 [Candidatus Methanolliviera sp. GoM_asphalt]